MERYMVLNLSHYIFFELKDPRLASDDFVKRIEGHDIRGTVILAPEGVNMNLASVEQEFLLETVEQWLADFGAPKAEFKLSLSENMTFKRLRMKVKKEIITMGDENLRVQELKAPHMSPKDFTKKLLNLSDETLILDTRNDFEVEYGTFKGAKPAGMKSFRDFPKVADELPKDREIIMFCTGGVRCEKASALLRKKGFEKVYQLEGGILRYLEEEGPALFEGECFVFDQRISLGSIEKVGDDGSKGFGAS